MAGRRLRTRLSSIRARTTAAACVVVAGALVAGMVVLLAVLHRTLLDNVDDGARVRAQDVAMLVSGGDLPATLAVHGDEDAFVQVVDANGKVLAASTNLDGIGPIASFRPERDQPVIHTTPIPVIDEDGDDFRVVAAPAQTERGPVTVYVAAHMDRMKETISTVRKMLLIGLPVLLAIVGVTAWQVVGRALRPVDAMRREVAEIGERDLARRVPEPPVDDEIGRLAKTMNQMLDRLETSSERQRRFVADASHELQSPLAASRADLEVALAHPESAQWTQTATDLVADNQRMTRLVQDLLFLARSDGAVPPAPTALIDLDDVVRGELARQRIPEGITLDASRVAAVEVRGDADQLTRVLRNLFDNAVRHARSVVVVELTADASGVTLAVADDGPGVPAEARDRIFERFTRLDDSRSRFTGGTGLGLAIAREIVEAHRGTISLDPDAPGARFVVRLPNPSRRSSPGS
jgi:signal transduction histidine kinase